MTFLAEQHLRGRAHVSSQPLEPVIICIFLGVLRRRGLQTLSHAIEQQPRGRKRGWDTDARSSDTNEDQEGNSGF